MKTTLELAKLVGISASRATTSSPLAHGIVPIKETLQMAGKQVYRQNILNDVHLAEELLKKLKKLLDFHMDRGQFGSGAIPTQKSKLYAMITLFAETIKSLKSTYSSTLDPHSNPDEDKKKLYYIMSYFNTFNAELASAHHKIMLNSQKASISLTNVEKAELENIPQAVQELMELVSKTPIEGDTPETFIKYLRELLLGDRNQQPTFAPDEMSRRREEVRKLNETKKSLEGEISRLRDELLSANKQITGLKDKMKFLDEELAQLREGLSGAEKENEGLKDQETKLKSEIDRLKIDNQRNTESLKDKTVEQEKQLQAAQSNRKLLLTLSRRLCC